MNCFIIFERSSIKMNVDLLFLEIISQIRVSKLEPRFMSNIETKNVTRFSQYFKNMIHDMKMLFFEPRLDSHFPLYLIPCNNLKDRLKSYMHITKNIPSIFLFFFFFYYIHLVFFSIEKKFYGIVKKRKKNTKYKSKVWIQLCM